MIAKFISLNLQNLIALYLFKLKHLLDCINLYRDFFNKIGSSYKYLNYKMFIYQPNIVEIIIYYKIIKKQLGDKYEVYNNKKCAI